MAMKRRLLFISKIRPFISSSYPNSHTFTSSSAIPNVLSDAKAAAKAWDTNMHILRKAAGVKLTEANVHFSIYQACIHAGQPPDSSKFSEAAAFLEAKFADAEALIAQGEARVAEGKAFVLKLKARIEELEKEIEAAAEKLDKKKRDEKALPLVKASEAKRHFAVYEAAIKAGKKPYSAAVQEIITEAKEWIAPLEDLIAVVKAHIKEEEASIAESKKQLAEIEVCAVDFEVLNAAMEAGVGDFKARMAEMQARMADLVAQVVARCARNPEMEAQIGESVKQTREFEAKIAVTKKLSASAAENGIWERVRRFFL